MRYIVAKVKGEYLIMERKMVTANDEEGGPVHVTIYEPYANCPELLDAETIADALNKQDRRG